MKRLMPLKRAVVEVTHEAAFDDDAEVRRAVKSWHNRLATGSVPRYVVQRLGRQLFLDLDAWDQWWDERTNRKQNAKVGRPRNGE